MSSVRHGVGMGVVALLAALATARADIIHLKGGKVEGLIVERTEDKVVVRTRAGKVTLAAGDIVRIERKLTPLSVYFEQSAKLRADDAEGHFQLSLWCSDQKLTREARLELRKTFKIDPNHKGAREKLGYVLKDGRWLSRDEAKKAEGLVRHDGQWVAPEVREKALNRKAVLGWRATIRSEIQKGSRTANAVSGRLAKALGSKADANAEAALRMVLREMVKEAWKARRDRTAGARIALVDALAAKPSTETNELLQRVAIQDCDALVRTAAIKALAVQKKVENTAYFVGLLRRFTDPRYRIRGSKRTRAIAREALRRASSALGELSDARAVPALVNALIVRFHIAENSDEIPPMTMSFSASRFGGGSVVTDSHGNQMVVPVREGTNFGLSSDGTGEAVEDGFFFNEAAYSSLRKLTGEDFSHDKTAWLAWWYRNRHNLVD